MKTKAECTHNEYYAQFITPEYIVKVENMIGKNKILNSKDEHFNDIPLRLWDNILAPAGTLAKMEQIGDWLTLSSQVCIAKEAARLIKLGKHYE